MIWLITAPSFPPGTDWNNTIVTRSLIGASGSMFKFTSNVPLAVIENLNDDMQLIVDSGETKLVLLLWGLSIFKDAYFLTFHMDIPMHIPKVLVKSSSNPLSKSTVTQSSQMTLLQKRSSKKQCRYIVETRVASTPEMLWLILNLYYFGFIIISQLFVHYRG